MRVALQQLVAPTVNDSLNRWLDYWLSIHTTGIDLGLERVKPVADYLGLTAPNAKVITVAGTNGKGSTTTTIASILKQQGYKVGLYQSPHIYKFNERVKLNGVEVNDLTLIQAFEQIEQARIACNLTLSFFEATTLAALWIFKHQQCDVWVLEVGLGGRLDVVNVIDADVVVITNIGLDHIDWLGDTIEKIAYEKAGVIRRDIPVIFAGEQEIPQAILDKVEQENARLYTLNRDYFYRVNEDLTWSYASEGLTLALPESSLAIANLSAGITAVLLSGLKVEKEAIFAGVAQAKLAGRFEVRQVANKHIIFDAGHNAHGIEFLLKQLKQYQQQNPQYTEIVCVFSMLADKDIESVTTLLKPHIHHWYIAPLHNERAANIERIEQALDQQQRTSCTSVKGAFQEALNGLELQQLILVCGSFHTLEEVWDCLENE